jgi:hypothetical protein
MVITSPQLPLLLVFGDAIHRINQQISRRKYMKKLKVAWLIGLVTFSALLQAQGIPLKTTTGGDVGLQASSYKYEETQNDSFFMSYEGKKIGLTGSFTQALENSWYWGIDARYATGSNSYTSATRGNSSNNSESYVDLRVTAGKDFEGTSNLLSPYAGLGYRSLSDDSINYSTTGNLGYRRKSTYIYIPIGVTHRVRLGAESRLSTTLEYDYLFQGTQRSYWTDIVGYTSDMYNTQRYGYGARLSVAYETATWSAGIFYHYWNIQDSDIGAYTIDPNLYNTGIIPSNISQEFGVQVKYHFN